MTPPSCAGEDAGRRPLAGLSILFDLDGTLVDTAPDLVGALNAAIAADGLPPVPIAEVRALVGHGARALLRRGYARCGTSLPDPVFETRVAAFLAHYRANIARHSVPFVGAVEALDALARSGAELSIATNKPDAMADALLDALGLTGRFARIIGPERAGKKKPAAQHLAVAAGSVEQLARSVMVGDSEPDAAAARAAGVPCILMRHGYSAHDLDALGAQAVVDTFEEVVAWIHAHAAANSPGWNV